MKVHIEENLYLESDERCFVIKDYSGKKDVNGKDLYKTHGYYSTIQQAIKKLVQMKIKQTTAQTLSELVTDVKRIELYIESKLTA